MAGSRYLDGSDAKVKEVVFRTLLINFVDLEASVEILNAKLRAYSGANCELSAVTPQALTQPRI